MKAETVRAASAEPVSTVQELLKRTESEIRRWKKEKERPDILWKID